MTKEQCQELHNIVKTLRHLAVDMMTPAQSISFKPTSKLDQQGPLLSAPSSAVFAQWIGQRAFRAFLDSFDVFFHLTDALLGLVDVQLFSVFFRLGRIGFQFTGGFCQRLTRARHGFFAFRNQTVGMGQWQRGRNRAGSETGGNRDGED